MKPVWILSYLIPPNIIKFKFDPRPPFVYCKLVLQPTRTSAATSSGLCIQKGGCVLNPQNLLHTPFTSTHTRLYPLNLAMEKEIIGISVQHFFVSLFMRIIMGPNINLTLIAAEAFNNTISIPLYSSMSRKVWRFTYPCMNPPSSTYFSILARDMGSSDRRKVRVYLWVAPQHLVDSPCPAAPQSGFLFFFTELRDRFRDATNESAYSRGSRWIRRYRKNEKSSARVSHPWCPMSYVSESRIYAHVELRLYLSQTQAGSIGNSRPGSPADSSQDRPLVCSYGCSGMRAELLHCHTWRGMILHFRFGELTLFPTDDISLIATYLCTIFTDRISKHQCSQNSSFRRPLESNNVNGNSNRAHDDAMPRGALAGIEHGFKARFTGGSILGLEPCIKQGYRLTRLRTNTLIINSIAIVLKSGVGQGYVFNTALFLLRLCTPFPVYFSKVRFAEIIIHGNGGIDASEIRIAHLSNHESSPGCQHCSGPFNILWVKNRESQLNANERKYLLMHKYLLKLESLRHREDISWKLGFESQDIPSRDICAFSSDVPSTHQSHFSRSDITLYVFSFFLAASFSYLNWMEGGLEPCVLPNYSLHTYIRLLKLAGITQVTSSTLNILLTFPIRKIEHFP
ncbi:hypothetical protein VP01_779g4 [Puccinia sorghi]|uniref:Uncharacterized protein n=1 Tax=Puccinia sorghi TaxID=27349 RepID=A0A0L6UC20_9BASI|nr:hypothetical protein VP01_779g4 [Puccinia sorghi]